MAEKLMNVKEVCRYLGILEEDLRMLVDRGEIPAYRLGGTILRFKPEQVEKLRKRGIPKIIKLEEGSSIAAENKWEKLKDFLYFNDFYLISAVLVIALLIIIFFY